ncbi:DNA ligase D [Rhodovarius crocodyli]|uniref:DNA ligase (ATP) n=1 Tax=Rhodovarius crocodyli TaxID=1979269 RepID=A0A437MDS1_9PROT|nr:DNA ligase D [Rhodovarius crocodyli]RVT95785.1 DNA ligase D [Rhodovarius crocodyli]
MSPRRLEPYNSRRDFSHSPEPRGRAGRSGKQLGFVVQKHDATRLHYDFRLEWQGVLKSWAVTRGPSLDPADKRLAVEVEDHPLDYGTFEGTIPKPAYGGGTVMLWDRGSWAPLSPKTVDEDLEKGELKFVLAGERLRGGFVLVRMKQRKGEKRHNWLLIKEKDSVATPGKGDAVLKAATSIHSGRTMTQIASGATQLRARPAAEPMPDFVPPQLCRLVDEPPGGDHWLHEQKFDGYRLQLRVQGGHVTIRTRTGLDWTDRFPTLAKAAARLPDALLDGEAVAIGEDGAQSFAALQATLAGEADHPLVFHAFDLLHDGKQDWRPKPLTERKAALRKLLRKAPDALRYVEDFAAPGDIMLDAACRTGMEGIVSKRGAAPYRSGRDGGWTKAKCRNDDEFVIGGFTRDKHGKRLGALLLGVREKVGLRYAGRVGTGFSEATARRLVSQLEKLVQPRHPFTAAPERQAGGAPIWVQPQLVAQVAYGGFGAEGLLRHASFQGLREDKPAREVKMPSVSRLTHPERVLWPATDDQPALTKADLAAWYERYADAMLPYVAGRPLALLRAPDGIDGQHFFQRHPMRGQPDSIGSLRMPGQSEPYLRIDSAQALMDLAQISALELHPGGARADAPEWPDRLIFDLDPSEGADFRTVRDAALELRDRLKGLGLESIPRLTGGKGIHVLVPLKRSEKDGIGWAAAKQFARLLCAMMEHDAPDRYTTALAKKARKGRIFLDYLRNDLLATAVASFSPRARPGAPVALPVTWAQVERGWRRSQPFGPAAIHLSDGLRRGLKDAWPALDDAARPLRDAMRRLLQQQE